MANKELNPGKTPERLFDRRTLERTIRKGQTTRKDYDEYVKKLPDRAANSEWIIVQEDD
jgi:hypothetical protein